MDRESALSCEDEEGRYSPRDNMVPSRTDTPGPIPTYQYSRDKLYSLKTSKEASRRPHCLSEDFNTADGLWDPERWFRSFDNSRGNSPMNVQEREWKRSGGDQDREMEYTSRRRPSDPKERLKEEKDGIVLSPQRRSFGTGCHVSQLSLSRQVSCPADYKEGSERDRERNPRRIGSGRIQIDRDRNIDRDRDRDQPRERGERDFRAIRDRYDDRDRDRRFDRDRGFRRDYDERREFSRHYNNSGGRMRRDSYNRHGGGGEDEPEWFTGGPTSQNDTIELRGFEKPEDKKNRKGNRQRREEDDDMVEEEERQADMVEEGHKDDIQHHEEEEERRSSKGDVGGVANVVDRNGSLETNESSSPDELNHTDMLMAPSPHSDVFDFNEFFKTDLPGLQQEGVAAGFDLPGVQSRFTQWFVSRHSGSHHNSRENSRRSSFNEDFINLNDLLGGTRSPIIPSPPPPSANSVFDPSTIFSPANSTFADKPQHLSVDSPGLHKANIGPMLNALFQSSMAASERSSTGSPGNMSIQDAEAQLKALLFGKKSFTPSSSGTGTPGMSSPLNVLGKAKTLAELEADMKHQQSSQPGNRNFTPPPMPTIQQLSQRPPSSSSPSSSHFPYHNQHQHPPPSMGPPTMPPPPPQQQQQVRSTPPQPVLRRGSSQDEDLTAFNKLLSLMQAGAAEAVQSPKLPVQQRPESPKQHIQQLQQQQHPPPGPQPILSQQPPPQVIPGGPSAAQSHNEFMQALIRNKEQQLHIRQHTLQQMRIQNAMQNTASPQQVQQNQPTPQQLAPPPAPQQCGGDPVLNFIKQNPTIITKSASPTPPPQQIPSQPPLQPPNQQAPPPPAMIGLMNASSPRAPSPTPIQVVRTNFVPQPPSSPRVPSPIMFSQQPPMHLSAPSPIHPSQMPQSTPVAVPVAANTITSTSTIRPPSVPRVPSPQELIAHTQAIMQTALLKKQLEDQKERFIKKQQERGKSPNPLTDQMKLPQTSTPVAGQGQIQAQSQPKPSVTAAFTPTSVIRKMHSDKASEKEKSSEKVNSDGSVDSPAPPAPVRQLIKPDGTPNLDNSGTTQNGDDHHGQINFQAEIMASIQSSMSGPPPMMNSFSNIPVSSQGGDGITAGIPNFDQPPPGTPGSINISRALVGQGAMQGSIPVQVQTVQTPISVFSSGRPIVKGGPVNTITTPSHGRPMMGGNQVTTPQLMKPDQNQSTPLQHRPIVGTAGPVAVSTPAADINKLLQQRQINISPNPLTRPVPGTPVTPGMPFGSIPITGRIPVQPNVPPVNVRNGALLQQMMQGGIRSAARVNALNQMNQINQINQLAIQAQQQRIVDPRFQGMRGVYPAGAAAVPSPTGLASRNPVQTTLGMGGPPLNVAISRALSPQVPAQKSVMNGPVSPIMPTSVHSMVFKSNNNISKPGDPNLLKWFGSDVLTNQMPNMPPLPAQGQRVMTVDEIERCQQQAVTN